MWAGWFFQPEVKIKCCAANNDSRLRMRVMQIGHMVPIVIGNRSLFFAPQDERRNHLIISFQVTRLPYSNMPVR
jgi:hypothetical protein